MNVFINSFVIIIVLISISKDSLILLKQLPILITILSLILPVSNFQSRDPIYSNESLIAYNVPVAMMRVTLRS